LELPSDLPITISVSIDSDLLRAPEPFTVRFAEVEAHFTRPGGVQSIERTAVRAAETLVEQVEANLRAVQAERRPLITGNSSYAKVAYPSHVFSGFNDLRTNWTFAVTMTIPIFTGGRLRAEEEVARAELEDQRAQLDLTRELADLEARTVWAEVLTAHANWQATDSSVEFARRAYEIAEIRFQAGVSTQLELSDARLQLQQSEANRAQAGRNLQVARIKAALLPDLPISTTTSTINLPVVTTPVNVITTPGNAAQPQGRF
jgi:outer membrane protein TolC